MAGRAAFHGRVRTVSTRTAKAKKAKTSRYGKKAKSRTVNAPKGF